MTMAWRNIWRNKIRSLVIMCSISLGLLAGFFVLALYQGMMDSRIRTVISSEEGNLQIHHPQFSEDFSPDLIIPNKNEIRQILLTDDRVQAFCFRSIAMGMLNTVSGSAGIRMMGVDMKEEAFMTQLHKKIRDGGLPDSTEINKLVIGKKLADKLKIKTGNKVVFTCTDTAKNIISAAFRVKGIYESNNAPRDEQFVYISAAALNELLGMSNVSHEAAVLLKNNENTEWVQQDLKKQFPFLKIESWMQLSPETDLMVSTVDSMSSIIMGIILFALAFGIVNTMLMAILERTRELGLMMALGTNKLTIFLLVFWETVLLTIAGVPLGFLASITWISHLHRQGLDFSNLDKEVMSSFGFDAVIYPVFPTDKIGIVLIIVILTAVLSSLIPSFKALGLKPTEALRK